VLTESDAHATQSDTRLIISRIILETLKDVKLSYPKPDAKRLKELQSFRKQLAK
jgi:hypothetical protein